MAELVIEPNEISLNAVRYKITGPVQRTLSSVYPDKTVIGDYTRESHPQLSAITFNDWSGGLGLGRIIQGRGLDRAASATNTQILYNAGAFLLFARGGVAATPNSSTDAVINELGGYIYNALGTKIYKWDHGAATWSAALDTLPGTTPTVTDSINIVLGGTEYLVWATYDTTAPNAYGYTYTSNGSSFTDDTADVKYFAFWDDRLWGIDNTGQLWFSTTIGTETNDAKLPLPAGEVTALFTGPDAEGKEIIYAATKTGLWAHDVDNAKFWKTGVLYARNDYGGIGSRVWDGDICVPVGMALLRYNPRNGSVARIGLDRDAGVPKADRGHIKTLIPTPELLFAGVTEASSVAYNKVWAYNGRGWGLYGIQGNFNGNIYVSNVGSYRLWSISNTGAMEWLVLPTGQFNPEEDATLTYLTSSRVLDTPFWNADQLEVNKVGVRLLVETINPSSSQTVTMATMIDAETSYTTRGSAITASGVTTITLPGNVSTDVGLAFKRISIRATLEGGSTVNTPIVKSITLEYFKKLNPKWQFQVELDVNGDYKGKTPKELRAALLTAQETATLVEFTYRDPNANSDATFYVQARPVVGTEQTGYDERGTLGLVLVEV